MKLQMIKNGKKLKAHAKRNESRDMQEQKKSEDLGLNKNELLYLALP